MQQVGWKLYQGLCKHILPPKDSDGFLIIFVSFETHFNLIQKSNALLCEPEKGSQLFKIHSTTSTVQIWMIQISVESKKIKVFLWFFSLFYQHYKYTILVKITL